MTTVLTIKAGFYLIIARLSINEANQSEKRFNQSEECSNRSRTPANQSEECSNQSRTLSNQLEELLFDYSVHISHETSI
ncbi:hypothetical protein [Oceanobacillus picturae]|uniref:hypothetical protein n=1 Tax=Oceanobacillus picturae TaxID=171693 RepID=UPI0011CC515B|nr:hypothetical protein [Oceanobacillus picturae]